MVEWWQSPQVRFGLLGGLAALRLGCVGWRSSSRLRHQVVELVDSLLIALALVFLILMPFVVQSYFIPTESMVPNLRPGDWILANKFVYRLNPPRRGDAVVFRAPREALPMTGANPDRPTDYIKRVIGLPGDRIDVEPGVGVRVNGKLLDEPYLAHPEQMGVVSGSRYETCTVPDGYLFMMGDNRNNSSDSRVWGPLPMNRIEGKAMVIFWPPGRMHWVR